MTVYYFDTSIWLDFHERRGENGERAFKLILTLIKNGECILYSDLHISELKHLGYAADEINELLKIVKPDNIRRVHIHKEQKEEARKLSVQRKIPFGDAIHAVVARDNDAIVVSRDRDFDKLRDIVETKRPEELY